MSRHTRFDAIKGIGRSLFYETIERLTLGRGVKRIIHGESIRFPPRWSRYYPSNYGTAKYNFLRDHCLSGQTVLDLGAHIGLFSVLMARFVGQNGRVFSFEPSPTTRAVLQRTVYLNKCQHIVEVCAEAVSNRSGQATFYEAKESCSNANALVQGTTSNHPLQVTTITVDDIMRRCRKTISCIKIDVEGSELDVLRGAMETIRVCRPVMVLEIHPQSLASSGGSVEELWNLFRDCQYVAFDAKRLLDRNAFCDLTDLTEIQVLPREHPRLEAGGR